MTARHLSRGNRRGQELAPRSHEQVAKVSQGPSLHLSGYRAMELTKILWKTILEAVRHRFKRKFTDLVNTF
jgi:hypothetical protein